VSGLGPLNPLTSMEKLGLTWPEAVFMWLTGEAPRGSGRRHCCRVVCVLLHE
jgi:hypothetical protein